jgi:TRAP-type C4-dicarboxylate transport system permease small subunit
MARRQMNRYTRAVVGVARAVNRGTIVACGLFMAALTFVVLLQVLYRYVLELPLIWSEEAARHLLVWLSFIGGGVAIAQTLNPRIEVIDSLCSAAARRWIEVVISILVLMFLIGFIAISMDVALTYSRYRTLALGLPQSVPRLALPVSGCLMAINTLAKLLERIGTPLESGATRK